MNANIYKFEFRTRLKSVLTWSLSIAFLVIFFFSLYPAFSKDASVLMDLLSKYPKEMLAAFGLNNIDPSTLLGFYAFLFIFIQLCLAIQASNYGFGLVSIEENELTADFLLSKPVSRPQVLTSKLLAAFTCLTITNLSVWLCTFIAIGIFRGDSKFEMQPIFLLLLSIATFQLIFLSVGLVVSLLVKRVRSVTPYALGLAFGAYVINGFSGIFGEVKLELITPFKHFDAAFIVKNNAYNTPLVLLALAVSLLSLAASYWLYIRRDIPSVS